MIFFSDFHYSFRCSYSTADLLINVSDKAVRVLVGLRLLELYPVILAGLACWSSSQTQVGFLTLFGHFSVLGGVA